MCIRDRSFIREDPERHQRNQRPRRWGSAHCAASAQVRILRKMLLRPLGTRAGFGMFWIRLPLDASMILHGLRLVSKAALFLLGAAFGFAQPGVPRMQTVLDGVYTSAQAMRGKASYEASCASCHRADLSGFSGPPLQGALFLDRWREFTLNVLVEFI